MPVPKTTFDRATVEKMIDAAVRQAAARQKAELARLRAELEQARKGAVAADTVLLKRAPRNAARRAKQTHLEHLERMAASVSDRQLQAGYRELGAAVRAELDTTTS
ncbi:hypothetical protein [Raineyella fluvialis]|uniref:Uncharacterized protein n=1 Tax=Raineyella fluvialis TaxID=2662261 RepID=A0A5Q2FD56_9ACTN|nr:hypothetical protein [Raineyella fluvialis]QGF24739.1 hypothetical protein Rai3103_15120 [Raineyella fluvialis]